MRHAPTLNCARKRALPNSSCWARSFSATTSGLPTTSAPSGLRKASSCARVIGGQPRSRPIRVIIAAYDPKNSSAACSVVSAT